MRFFAWGTRSYFWTKSSDDSLLPFLGKLLGNFSVQTRVYGENLKLQGPFAGVLGWPAQCGGALHRCWPAMDEANLKTVVGAAGMA